MCEGSCRTLECLNITGFSVPDEEIGKIQATCRGLKRISMEGRSAALSKLFASYRNQLEWAYLPGFKEDHIKDVAVACKNARFHLFESSRKRLLTALNLLGPRLEMISVDLWNQLVDVHMSQFTAAWNRCVNLRKLSLDDCTIEGLEAVMATPKLTLKVISIELYLGATDADKKKARELCAERCINSEEISLS